MDHFWYYVLLGAVGAAAGIPMWELMRRIAGGKRAPVHCIRVQILTNDGQTLLDTDCETLYHIVKWSGMGIDMREYWPEPVGVRVLINESE